MANDGDRHQPGDPIRSAAYGDTATRNVLDDKTDPALLTEEELRRQLAYLVQFKGDIAHRAALRLRQLNIEHRRRVAVTTF